MPPVKSPYRRRGRPPHGTMRPIPASMAFCREVRDLVRSASRSIGTTRPDNSPVDNPYALANHPNLADHRALSDLAILLSWFMAKFLDPVD